jgi:hypothetical protein
VVVEEDLFLLVPTEKLLAQREIMQTIFDLAQAMQILSL